MHRKLSALARASGTPPWWSPAPIVLVPSPGSVRASRDAMSCSGKPDALLREILVHQVYGRIIT